MKNAAIPLVVVVVATLCFVGTASADELPMADAGLDQEVSVDTTVHLDATGSTHDDGSIEAYEWRIETPGGQQIDPECATCTRTTFVPTVPGRYDVELTVEDDTGATNTDVMYVYVSDAGPDVELSGVTAPETETEYNYVATATADGADLEEIGWAVEDELVLTRSLDGRADETELSLAFPHASTYRIQVVVTDEEGRTAYDDLFVRPSEDDPSSSGWEDVDTETPEPDCSDPDYAAANPDECLEPETETPTETPEPELGQAHDVLFESDGYGFIQLAGSMTADSSYMGEIRQETGLDGGAYDPNRQSMSEQVYDSTIGEASRILFGQEQETVSCEMTVGEFSGSCPQRVYELENEGRTTNINSPTESGGYSTYGIQNAERTAGVDPTDHENFNEGDTINVTVVIQEEEDGLVDIAVETADSLGDSASGVVGNIVGGDDGEPDEPERSTTEEPDSTPSTGSPSAGISPGTGLTNGSGDDPYDGGSTDSDSTSEVDEQPNGPTGVGGGLTQG